MFELYVPCFSGTIDLSISHLSSTLAFLVLLFLPFDYLPKVIEVLSLNFKFIFQKIMSLHSGLPKHQTTSRLFAVCELRPYLFISGYCPVIFSKVCSLILMKFQLSEQKLHQLGITHAIDSTNIPKTLRYTFHFHKLYC